MTGRSVFPAGRVLACGLLLLISGCVYFAKHTAQGACPSSLDSPIRNFCAVVPHVLWRGERPSRSDATWLLEHGVGSVVNLEVMLDDHWSFDAATPGSDSDQSVPYYHVPDFEPVHLVNWSLLDNHVAHFLAIMDEAPRPVYVHCLDGIDRTGVLIAAYRVVAEGVSRDAAIAEMARYGTPWLKVDARYIRSLDAARRAEILRQAARWKSGLEAQATIECRSGKCTFKGGTLPGGR